MQDYQLGALQRIVRHAYEQTTGYRRLFDEYGVKPPDIRSLEDLRKLPFLEKGMIQRDVEAFSSPFENRYYHTTGGSTGIPLGFYRDPVSWARELASKAHQYGRIGWRENDKKMLLRGSDPALAREPVRFEAKFNEMKCSSFFLEPQSLEGYCRRAREFMPDWLMCYPSAGWLLARFLRDTGTDFPPIKGVLCASENLYDFQKAVLAEVFGVRIFSHYGHCEMAVLAGFCEYEDTYHVLPQYGIAELIDAGGKPVERVGQMGEIVGTSLIMDATPFVRYRTGDFAVMKGWNCAACGRPYQVWERIEGRKHDFFVAAGGRRIAMTALNMHDRTFDHIRQFQFYQPDRGKVVFNFVPKPTCGREAVEVMKQTLVSNFGPDMVVEMNQTGEIQTTKRGKHRFLLREFTLEGDPA
jgi:phenylacetate-CoA ligase